LILCLCSRVIGAGQEKTAGLLPDGLLLKAIDGVVHPAMTEDLWVFELDIGIQSGRTVLAQGTRITLLPCSALESLLIQARDRSAYDYRLLQVYVTQYRGANYFFTGYFLPLSKKETNENKPDDPNAAFDVNQADTAKPGPARDNPLDIPQDVLDQLPMHRPIQIQPQTEALTIAPNTLILDRSGYLMYQNDQPMFVLDGWGQAREKDIFHVLPGAMLERMEQVQTVEAERSWFRIVGVVSTFQGTSYLFLHRAVRVYPYGNFNG
jgi:hypothetical protein